MSAFVATECRKNGPCLPGDTEWTCTTHGVALVSVDPAQPRGVIFFGDTMVTARPSEMLCPVGAANLIAALSATTFREDDVVDYDTDGREHHCREHVAVANADGILFDTFWAGSGDRHRLTPAERAAARLRFNLTDGWRPWDNRTDARWVDYAPADRECVSHQHGLRRDYYVRIGAYPDLDTKIANARQALADAEDRLHSAESAVKWATEDLNILLAKKGDR